MTALARPHIDEIRRHFFGWAVSLLAHGLVAGVAILAVSGARPPLHQKPFMWNVSIVKPPPQISQPAAPEPETAQSRPPVPQAPAAAPSLSPPAPEPEPAIATAAVEPSPSAAAKPAEPPPVAEQLPKEEPSPVPPQPVVASPPPPPAPPIPASRPAPASPQPASASPSPPPPPAIARQAAPPTPAAAPAVEPTRPTATPPAPPLTTASIPEPSQAPAPRAATSAPAKRDYGWLAETLGNRIEQFKRYPPVARLNQWEGKVVLRAVIKETGDVTDLRIVQSSGHDVLDQDALATLRQAAPLALPQPLGRPQIVIHVPISYQLK